MKASGFCDTKLDAWGAEVRALRVARGLTTVQLGVLCNLPAQTIRNVEAARHVPMPLTVQRLRRELPDLSMPYL